MCRFDLNCDSLNRLVLVGMHVLIATPRWQSLNVHWSIPVKYIEKRVVAMTHPCFTPFSTEKILDLSPSYHCAAMVIVMNEVTLETVFHKQLPFRPSLSRALVKSMNITYSGRFCSRLLS